MAEHKKNIFFYEAYYVKIVKEIMTAIDLFFKHFLYIYLLWICAYVCVHAYKALMWSSEGNSQQPVLSSYHVDYQGTALMLTGLAGSAFTHWV